MRKKKFRRALWPFPITLELQLQDKPPAEDAYGMTSQPSSLVILVQVYNKAVSDRELLNISIHEAMHAVQFIEETIGTKLDDESEAYWEAAIACWIVSKAQKQKKSGTQAV